MARKVKFGGGSTSFNFGHNAKPKGKAKGRARGGKPGRPRAAAGGS